MSPAAQPLHVRLLLTRFVVLVAAIAGGLAFVLSHSNGCAWPQALLRSLLSALACVALGGIAVPLLIPMLKAEPAPESEAKKTDGAQAAQPAR